MRDVHVAIWSLVQSTLPSYASNLPRLVANVSWNLPALMWNGCDSLNGSSAESRGGAMVGVLTSIIVVSSTMAAWSTLPETRPSLSSLSSGAGSWGWELQPYPAATEARTRAAATREVFMALSRSLPDRLRGDREHGPGEARLVDLDDDAEDVLPVQAVGARALRHVDAVVVFDGLRQIQEPAVRADAGEDAEAVLRAAAAGAEVRRARVEAQRLAGGAEVEHARGVLLRVDERQAAAERARDGLLLRRIGAGLERGLVLDRANAEDVVDGVREPRPARRDRVDVHDEDELVGVLRAR